MKAKLSSHLIASKVKKEILKRIGESKDDKLGKGKFWHSTSYMREFGFSDLMDFLLYYMSLQPDLNIFAAKVMAEDFLWKTVRAHWQKRAGKLLSFMQVFPWANGPGPMDGSAGPAESYILRNHLFDKTLLIWFLWPEELREESEFNWLKYKVKIEGFLFPRLRRKYNARKLIAALTFSEEICEIMRRAAAHKNQPT